MKALVLVARREIAERRFVLAAAAVASLLPFLAPLVPGIPASAGPMARAVVALTLSVTFGLSGSLLVGASVVGRELAERRLGFYFSRPLPAWALWAGKLLGGLLLVLASEAVVLLPASLASGRFPGLWGSTADTVALWGVLALPLLLFPLAWVSSVALRSRSPWLAVDFVLVPVVALAFWIPTRRLLGHGFAEGLPRLVGALAALFAVALAAATFGQLVGGRTDPRRGHGVQSLVLWGTLLAAALGYEVWSRRVVDPGVEGLVTAWYSPAGTALSWVYVSGTSGGSGHVRASYLVDLERRRSVLLPPAWGPLVSRDGTRALLSAWPDGFGSGAPQLVALDLAARHPASDPEEIAPAGGVTSYDLSADGRSAAVVSGDTVQVVRLPGVGLLASVRIPSAAESGPGGTRWSYEAGFLPDGKVRLLPRRRLWKGPAPDSPPAVPPPPILELDVAARRVSETGRYDIPPVSGGLWLAADGSGERLLVRAIPFDRTVWLLDARTGRRIATFEGAPDGKPGFSGFLADGRIVLLERQGDDRQVRVFDRDGREARSVPLGLRGPSVRVGPEVAPGVLPVAVEERSGNRAGREYRLVLVDVGAGRISPVKGDLRPALGGDWPWAVGLRSPVFPGSPASRLFLDADGKPVLLDPATGAIRPLDLR